MENPIVAGKFRSSLFRSFAVAVMLATASVALNAEHVVKKIVIGDTEVTVVESYKGSASLLRPTQAIVYDSMFHLT